MRQPADGGGPAGATSTVLVEYLRAAKLEPSLEVATALFYGMQTDSRAPDDIVEAYPVAVPRVDKRLLAGASSIRELSPAEYFPALPTWR